MQLTVASTSQLLQINSEKGRRLVLVVLSLLQQIDAIENGKLILSWGQESADIKWVVESHGRGAGHGA